MPAERQRPADAIRPAALLCTLTFFIGYLWLVPYMQTAFAAFYDDVKGRAAVA